MWATDREIWPSFLDEDESVMHSVPQQTMVHSHRSPYGCCDHTAKERGAIHGLSEISNPYDTIWDIRDRPHCVLRSTFGGAKFDRQLRLKSRSEAPLVAVAKVSKDVSSDLEGRSRAAMANAYEEYNIETFETEPGR